VSRARPLPRVAFYYEEKMSIYLSDKHNWC
jgi:hypothetical protein